MTEIVSRPPTGTIPWPLVLIEGGEKSGKSFACAQFTASERVGRALWLDLGEGAADEYAAIPGASYEVLVHDGTWPSIINQVEAVHAEAARALDAGEKPVVLIVDSMTAEWDMVKDWVSQRARSTKKAREILARDPDAEIKPAMNFWNDGADRHARLMHLLMTFPGIAVVTARGKEIAALDSDGRPQTGQKDYRVEGHKNLAFDASAWVRLSRDAHPLVVGVRSVHSGLRPGVDKPQSEPDFSIEWLVFDLMKCDPSTSRIRDHVPTQSVDFPPLSDAEVDVALADLAACESVDEVATIGKKLGGRVKASPRGAEIVEAANRRKADLAGADA